MRKFYNLLFFLIIISCSNNNDNSTKEIPFTSTFNQEGDLLEAVIDEALNFYELIIYDENNKPIFRVLDNYSLPTSYNAIFNTEIRGQKIHYYIYNSNKKVKETRIFDFGYIKNNRVFAVFDGKETDITDNNNYYIYFVHEYENERLKQIIVMNSVETDSSIQYNFDYNNNITKRIYDYFLDSEDAVSINYQYIENKIYYLTDLGKIANGYEYGLHNNINNPYYKLFVEFGIAPGNQIFTFSKPPYGAFYKFFIEKEFFVTSSDSYFKNLNEVISSNKLNYPKTTEYTDFGGQFRPKKTLYYTYKQ